MTPNRENRGNQISGICGSSVNLTHEGKVDMYFGSKAINSAFVTSKTQKQQIGFKKIIYLFYLLFNNIHFERLNMVVVWTTYFYWTLKAPGEKIFAQFFAMRFGCRVKICSSYGINLLPGAPAAENKGLSRDKPDLSLTVIDLWVEISGTF